MDKKDLKKTIIFVIILLAVSIAIIYVVGVFNKKEEYNHLKKYKANEYIPTYVSTEDMAKIYLNDYLFNLKFDRENAYNLLDQKYRESKYSSINDFNNYINSLDVSKIKVKKYLKQNKNGYAIYTIYDEGNNVFIFKTKGVMQYTVYLDSETVEVGD